MVLIMDAKKVEEDLSKCLIRQPTKKFEFKDLGIDNIMEEK